MVKFVNIMNQLWRMNPNGEGAGCDPVFRGFDSPHSPHAGIAQWQSVRLISD